MDSDPARNARIVNAGSRFALALAFAFTVVSLGSTARADTVALLPVDGRADPERMQEIEQIFAEELRSQGHTLAPPSENRVSRPPASAQMQSIATDSNASYVVAAEVEPLRGQYRLSLHVYALGAGRMEELVVTVLEADERARIRDVLASMVRPEGLGEDALRLTGEPESAADREAREAAAREAREAEEAAQREAEEAAQSEADAQAAREAEEQAAREAEEQAAREAEEREARDRAFSERVPYGADAPWMIQLAGGGGYAIPLGELNLPPDVEPGGGVFDFGIRAARAIEGVDGFEVRLSVDGHVGAYNALGIHAGAAWLASPFVEPVFIGLGGEVGVVFAFTGAREAGFSARVSALFAWRPVERLYLEVAIPELGIVTPGAGAVTIGASLRAGYRF